MATPSRLAKTLGAGANPAPSSVSASTPSSTRLRAKLANGRRGEDVEIPGIGTVFMSLPGATRWQEIEASVRREMRRLEVPDLGAGDITVAAAHEAELAIQVLADAAREPGDHNVAIGTREEWGELDNDVIGVAWHAFGDVRQRLDPVELGPTSDEMFLIASAVKKKDPASLRSFGVVKLSLWLATTDGLPSSSPQPSSPNTDSQSDSSE